MKAKKKQEIHFIQEVHLYASEGKPATVQRRKG